MRPALLFLWRGKYSAIMEMKIRYAAESDLDFLVEGRRQIRIAEKRTHIENGRRDRWELKGAIRKKNVRVMETGRKPAAFLWFRPGFKVMYMDNCLWVHLVYVKEEFRRRGLGRLLYEDAEKIAKSMGLYKIVIDVFEANRDSAEFHKKIGFEPLYTIYQKNI